MNQEERLFRCFAAETGEGEITGMVFCYTPCFTRVGKSLCLEDIWVKERFRQPRTGYALLMREPWFTVDHSTKA